MIPFLKQLIGISLEIVDPKRLVVDNLKLENYILHVGSKTFDLNLFEKIHVIGAGKAAPFLYEGLRIILGSRIHGGMIASLPLHAFTDETVKFYPGAHPYPEENSIIAGKAVVDYICTEIGKKDLVFFLITGGASAMLAQPIPGLNLEDKMTVNRWMLASGAEVTETNCVRKHMSALKGGKLARMISPAKIISLILSDIIDSPLEAIGSGPSMPDTTTITDALSILKKYHLFEKLKDNVQHTLEQFEHNPELSPKGISKEDDKQNTHFLIGDNRVALNAAKAFVQSAGIPVHILTDKDRGEASDIAEKYSELIKSIIRTGTPFKPPIFLLIGGELTVTIKRENDRPIGRGGRNHALILHMLKNLTDISHPFVAVSFGTDGIDGSSDAAGAWIDENSIKKAKELNLDLDEFIDNYDSHTFFEKMNQQIKTGPTRTNVMDLRFIYIPG